MQGFERGRNLEKLGQHAQDTAELFFDDVRVPVANLIGEEGAGLPAPHAQPRAGAAVDRGGRAAAARGALERDAGVRRERKAFGRPIGAFQNSRFELAEATTEIEVAQALRRPLPAGHTSAGRCGRRGRDGQVLVLRKCRGG